MVNKKITSLLLSASFLVTGFSGCFINAQPVQAITSVDELVDVQESNWAYSALKDLVEKYNVVEGFPNKTFRGNQKPNRYEMAAALDATIKAVGAEIAKLGAEKADKEDLAKLAQLQEEFSLELRALQARTAALEVRASKIESKNQEQDNRLAILDKLDVYGDATVGGFADMAGTPDNNNSYSDGISTIARARVNLDYQVVEDKPGSKIGEGTVHTRLVGAFGRSGGRTNDSYLTSLSTIAADSSVYDEGVGGTTISNIRGNAYVETAFYTQDFKIKEDSNWGTSAKLHAGLARWRDIFATSSYYGDELDQFQNSAFITNPANLQNTTAPRVALVVNQGLGKFADFAFKTDVSTINISNSTSGLGLTFEGDLGYNLGFLSDCDYADVNGKLYLGYYTVFADTNLANTVADTKNRTKTLTANLSNYSSDNANGLYLGMDQELYKGAGIFWNYTVNNSNNTSALLSALQATSGTNQSIAHSDGKLSFTGVRDAFTVGTEVPMTALANNFRQNDTFGAAYGVLTPNTNYAGSASAADVTREKVAEFYYKAQINDNISVVPSLQITGSRHGNKDNGHSVALGFRTNFKF